MLLASAFLKENPVISLEAWILVFQVFTTATMKLRAKVCNQGYKFKEVVNASSLTVGDLSSNPVFFSYVYVTLGFLQHHLVSHPVPSMAG